MRYQIDPPKGWNIRGWYRQFVDIGCVFKGKSPGRRRVSEVNVARTQIAFQGSPTKSTRGASRELQLPTTTIWHVLRRPLVIKPYKGKRKRVAFCNEMSGAIVNDNTFAGRIVFSDEATFQVSGKINTMLEFGGIKNPHTHIEHIQDSPEVNVFCAISHSSVYGPFSFDGNTVAILENWLFPSLRGQHHLATRRGFPSLESPSE